MDIDRGCSLARPGGPGHCDWCGTKLGKYRRRWCSEACSDAAVENHSWTYAREAALRRDQRTCQRCGYQKAPQPRWRDYPTHLYADPDAAYWADYNAWRRTLLDLEVNHKIPILGLHGHSGCHHHLDGLETLCRPCHLEETARQRRERAANLRRAQQLYRDGDEEGAAQLTMQLFEVDH